MPSRKKGGSQKSKPDGASRGRLKSRLLRLPKRARLQEMATQLNSDDPMVRREVADVFKSVLSKGGGVQADEIIALGVLPRFVEFLQCHDDPILQIEASMILNSIVTSDKPEHTAAVVEAQAVPHLVELLKCTNETANLQAAWVLNNIASESVAFRDQVVTEGSMTALLNSMQEIPFPEAGQLALKTQLSALLSFCGDRLGDRSKLPMDVITPALSVLKDILEREDPKPDDEVLSMVCSVVSCISKDGEDESIGKIVDAGLGSALVSLLRYKNPRVQAAAVRALGNLVSGDDERHTQSVLDCGALPSLLVVLRSSNHLWETRSDICWMLSNIAVGSLEQIQLLIDSGLIPTLVKLLEDQTDHLDVRTEAAWVVSNSAASGCRKQVAYLAQEGCIRVLSTLLVLNDDCDLEMVNGVLHALENILEAGAAEAAAEAATIAGIEPVPIAGSTGGGTEGSAQGMECADGPSKRALEGDSQPAEKPAKGGEQDSIVQKEKKPHKTKSKNAAAERKEEAKAKAKEEKAKAEAAQAEATAEAAEGTTNGTNGTCTEQSTVAFSDTKMNVGQGKVDEGMSEGMGDAGIQHHAVMGAPAASAALPYVPNQYAVMLEQCGGVERISSFLSLSDEYTVVESARRILENHFGMKNTASEVSLHCAAHDGNLECATKLLNRGADVNAQDSEGRTPLAIASSLGHLELVQELVKSLADINTMDRMQATPIRLSAANGYKEITRYLIKHLKEQEERRKENEEEEKRQHEEELRKQREALLRVVQGALEARPCDWSALKTAVDDAGKHHVQAQPVQLASRLLSARSQLTAGIDARDKERLQAGMEQLKRARGMLGGDNAADDWLGQLSEEAEKTLQWLQDESSALQELKAAIESKDTMQLANVIQKVETIQESLQSPGLEEHLNSARTSLEQFSLVAQAREELRAALETMHTQKLAQAITNADKCGLNSDADQGRKVLKKLINSAKKELQQAITSRQVSQLKAAIAKVEKLSIESLDSELDVARKATQAIELEEAAHAQLEDALRELREAMGSPPKRWSKLMADVESCTEALAKLGLKKQVEQARTDMSSTVQEREIRLQLEAALQSPAKLSAAIEATQRSAVKSKVRPLLSKAEAKLTEAVDELAAEALAAINTQHEAGVKKVIEKARGINMEKALVTRSAVKIGLAEMKKAKAAAERTVKLEEQRVAKEVQQKAEAERKEALRQQKEADRKENERKQAEREAARKEAERLEAERLEVERAERERRKKIAEEEALEKERRKQAEKDLQDKELQEAEAAEKEAAEKGMEEHASLSEQEESPQVGHMTNGFHNTTEPGSTVNNDDIIATDPVVGDPEETNSRIAKPEKRRRKDVGLNASTRGLKAEDERSHPNLAGELQQQRVLDGSTVTTAMPREGRRGSSRLPFGSYGGIGTCREENTDIDASQDTGQITEVQWISSPETPSKLVHGASVSESPSEDAFIQSILGELDLDMDM